MESRSDSSRVFRFGSFELDRATGELRKKGVRVKLQEQPFRVLAALLEQPGELITREELQEKLWPGDTHVEFDQNLNAVVKKVRRALGDSSETPRFIETLPKKGYRFVYPVEGTDGEGVARAGQEKAASRSEGGVESTMAAALARRRVWIAGIVVAIVVTLAIVIASRPGWGPSESAASLSNPKSIAVLPLENLSGDPEQEYFADGMTDMLITDLGTISALRVISRTSVMQYKNAKMPLSAIGRELDVSHLVEGAVLREGDDVRIGVRLMEASEERQVWGESFQRPLGEVLTLQREIARAVADAVQVKLDPSERARLDRGEAVSPEAIDAYLRGWDAWWDPKKGGLRKAAEYYEEAIERSPNYAQAYVGLGAVYFLQAFGWDQHLTPAEAELKARLALNKALEIDETLAAAYATWGDLRRSFHYDWEGAETSYRRSLELNPNGWYCHLTYAFFLAEQGRSEEAIREATLARGLDPNSPVTRFHATLPYLWVFRDFDKHISVLQSLLKTGLANYHVVHIRLGEDYLQKGLYDEALAAFHKARDMSDDNLTLASLGYGYGVTGKTRDAREILENLLDRSKKRPVSSDHFARVYVGLGDHDRAIDALYNAYDERAPLLTYLQVEPVWYSLRHHPRFQALLKKMNFPE